jgi:hypothetical protein
MAAESRPFNQWENNTHNTKSTGKEELPARGLRFCALVLILQFGGARRCIRDGRSYIQRYISHLRHIVYVVAGWGVSGDAAL